MESNDTVSTMKVMIQNELFIRLDEQRIIFAGKQLNDYSTLDECNVKNDTTVHLVLRLSTKVKPVAEPARETAQSKLARVLRDLARELQDEAKHPSGGCTDTKVLGPLTYADAAHLLLMHPARTAQLAAVGWLGVGRTTRRSVHGAEHTQQHCFLEAVHLDAANSLAWRCLGATLAGDEAVSVNGERCNRTQCMTRGAPK
jgi:hypothetical protein